MEEIEGGPPAKPKLEKEMPDRDIQILSDFYSKHHLGGNRRNQSVSEEKRSQLFKKWIGKNRKVLDNIQKLIHPFHEFHLSPRSKFNLNLF